MKEGWKDDDYFMLFDEAECEQMTDAYGIRQHLPGLTVVGIVGWDDFIVRNEAAELFQVPTVPLLQKYMTKREPIPDASSLVADERFTGKIRWYTKPIVLGGDPNSEENIIWVDIRKHQELVRWWNQKYQEISSE